MGSRFTQKSLNPDPDEMNTDPKQEKKEQVAQAVTLNQPTAQPMHSYRHSIAKMDPGVKYFIITDKTLTAEGRRLEDLGLLAAT